MCWTSYTCSQPTCRAKKSLTSMMMPQRLLPRVAYLVLQCLSKPCRSGDEITDRGKETTKVVADGYRSQTDLLAVPCEAVLLRTAGKVCRIILEGRACASGFAGTPAPGRRSRSVPCNAGRFESQGIEVASAWSRRGRAETPGQALPEKF